MTACPCGLNPGLQLPRACRTRATCLSVPGQRMTLQSVLGNFCACVCDTDLRAFWPPAGGQHRGFQESPGQKESFQGPCLGFSCCHLQRVWPPGWPTHVGSATHPPGAIGTGTNAGSAVGSVSGTHCPLWEAESRSGESVSSAQATESWVPRGGGERGCRVSCTGFGGPLPSLVFPSAWRAGAATSAVFMTLWALRLRPVLAVWPGPRFLLGS